MTSIFFVAGATYPDFGHCISCEEPFVTLISKYPPATGTAIKMLAMGYEVYYQPVPYHWGGFKTHEPNYITTYRRLPNAN